MAVFCANSIRSAKTGVGRGLDSNRLRALREEIQVLIVERLDIAANGYRATVSFDWSIGEWC
jgi:hypothetical protein